MTKKVLYMCKIPVKSACLKGHVTDTSSLRLLSDREILLKPLLSSPCACPEAHHLQYILPNSDCYSVKFVLSTSLLSSISCKVRLMLAITEMHQ